GLATRGLVPDRKPAPDVSVAVELLLIRLVDPAAIHHSLAAGMKAAALREIRQIGRLARNAVQRLLDPQLRNGGEQRPGIWMPRPVEEAPDRLHLHDPSG